MLTQNLYNMKKQLQLFFSIGVAVFFCMNTYAQPDTLSTSYERGADAHVTNDDKNGPDENFGEFKYLVIRNHEVRQRIIYLKFDIEYYDRFDGANEAFLGLNVKYAEKMAAGETSLEISVYGLIDEGEYLDEEWEDTLITYNTAPGLEPTDLNYYELDDDMVEYLTYFTVLADSTGWVYTELTEEMDAFINADEDDLLTFILIIEETNTGDEVRIFTEEDTATNKPPILHAGEPISIDGIDDSKIGSGINLEQNFPNPFIGSTTLLYNLDQPEYVELTMYNMLGAKVTTLVNEFQKTGKYNVNVDMDRLQLPHGVYFAKFSVGSVSKTIKMIYGI